MDAFSPNFFAMVAALISLQEAADELGVHYMTAYRYVRTGRLPAVKEGAEWRVDPADLALLEVGRRTTTAPVTGETEGGPDRRWRAEPLRLAGRLIDGDEPGALASRANSPESPSQSELGPLTQFGERRVERLVRVVAATWR